MAGLKVNEALQAITVDTEGFLEDYRAKLLGKSFCMKIEPIWEKAKPGTEYVARVSFGTALVASIVLVYTAIIVAISCSRSEDDNHGRRGRSYDSGFNFYMNPADLICIGIHIIIGVGERRATIPRQNSSNLFSHSYLGMVIQIKELNKRDGSWDSTVVPVGFIKVHYKHLSITSGTVLA